MVYLQTPRVFQSLMVLSREPETIWRLSAEKATLKTSFEWPTNILVVWPLRKRTNRASLMIKTVTTKIHQSHCQTQVGQVMVQVAKLILLHGAINNGIPTREQLNDLSLLHLRAKVPQAEGRVPSSWQSKLTIGGDDHITHKVRVARQGALGDAVVGLITGQLPHDQRLVWEIKTNLAYLPSMMLILIRFGSAPTPWQLAVDLTGNPSQMDTKAEYAANTP